MSTPYEPKNHIQPLAIAPRAEGILDQREITIQSYQTTIPFDHPSINEGLDKAWLTPLVRFGVFSRTKEASKNHCTVILGLQDDLSIRAYDYDARRPLWYSWQDVVVETVSVHYYRDEDGLLQFKTTGGGRRITDDRLYEFNATYLRIPKESVTKRSFDLDKLREMSFERFHQRLYMLRFSDPSGKEYRSIDHALFQSRQYIDPNAERLEEIRKDEEVTIESFDSDIDVRARELAEPIKVRFFLRGLSGSLRLRFPNVRYKKNVETLEEQVRLFYHLVDVTENLILDADYYVRMPRSLDELDAVSGLFVDSVDLSKFREVLLRTQPREQFFRGLNLTEPWNAWQPHLRALGELIPTGNVAEHVAELVQELTVRAPRQAANLLAACLADAKMHSVGHVVASVLAEQIYAVSVDSRTLVEASLLQWAMSMEEDTWDVDPDSDEISVFNLRWKKGDLSLDLLPGILVKLIGLFHTRLTGADGDGGKLLDNMHWCVSAARLLPPLLPQLPSPLRLLAEGKVPASIAEGSRILRSPVNSLAALDDAVLGQFGVPMWPLLTATRENGRITVQNIGLGTARSLKILRHNALFGVQGFPTPTDLLPGTAIKLDDESNASALDIDYEKFGAVRRLT